jgi:hypothetical protein
MRAVQPREAQLQSGPHAKALALRRSLCVYRLAEVTQSACQAPVPLIVAGGEVATNFENRRPSNTLKREVIRRYRRDATPNVWVCGVKIVSNRIYVKSIKVLAAASCWLVTLLYAVTPAFSSTHSHYERPTKKDEPYKDRVIVFVHGLFGNEDDTWRYSPGVYWPKLLLTDQAFQGDGHLCLGL